MNTIDDKYIFRFVANFEASGIYTSEQSVNKTASILGLSVMQVMEACNRWINEGQFA
ncbi:MAG TPA: hypothetical protein VLG09_02630 [Candidatus Saccharimonadales bacterium]|nr:hypothetical protein [Candidatus Saccharimonadales bacterium]